MRSEIEPLIKNTNSIEIKSSLSKDRNFYHQPDFNSATYYDKTTNKEFDTCCLCHPIICFRGLFPIFEWFPQYNFRSDFLADVISGITVAVLHIPQGMAYGLLGNLPPVYGIYMAFFPVLVYFFFTSSRHASMGAIGIVCLMTGKVVSEYSSEDVNDVAIKNLEINGTMNSSILNYTNLQIATTVTFTVAIIQILMYIFHLGALSTLLSPTLVNSFITGAGIHIILSQLKDLLGLDIQRRIGLFKNGYIVFDAIIAIPKANHIAVMISFSAILFMYLNNTLLKPLVNKYSTIPLPVELITICLGTLLSYLIGLNEKYDVSLVGTIPTGLPEPTLPAFELIPNIALDSLSIAIVSYTITLSMSLIIAQKMFYEVDKNQEFLAMGAGNMFGSFFGCMPFSASLSRSLIQQVTGGVSQIASLVSCAVLLILLLWIGPIFEFLPRSVLASIIVVALRGIFTQAKELKKYWKLNKLEALVWLVTFTGVVLLDIDIGLVLGVIISIIVICLQSLRIYSCILGRLPNTSLYFDINRNKEVKEIDNIKIFHYCGPLNFATKSMFTSKLYKTINLNPRQIIKQEEILSKISTSRHDIPTFEYVIIDFSALYHIDPEGVKQIKNIKKEFHELGIKLCLASLSGPIYDRLQQYNMYENQVDNYLTFPNIHDAVLYAQENQKEEEIQ